jgi:uncharacterized protein YcbK (DUF882 family)
MSTQHRREFFKFVGSAAAAASTVSATSVLAHKPARRSSLHHALHHAHGSEHAAAAPVVQTGAPIRRVAFHNLHTGEKVDAVYWEKGAYVPDALSEVNHVLRDFRNGQVHAIDPGLLNLLDTLSARVGTRGPFHVISGYRSPQTNAMLRRNSPGVARDSLHMRGTAIDIRLEDVDLARLHQAALSLRGGGVGYYPASDFVHVDVGPVRHWG